MHIGPLKEAKPSKAASQHHAKGARCLPIHPDWCLAWSAWSRCGGQLRLGAAATCPRQAAPTEPQDLGKDAQNLPDDKRQMMSEASLQGVTSLMLDEA